MYELAQLFSNTGPQSTIQWAVEVISYKADWSFIKLIIVIFKCAPEFTQIKKKTQSKMQNVLMMSEVTLNIATQRDKHALPLLAVRVPSRQ